MSTQPDSDLFGPDFYNQSTVKQRQPRVGAGYHLLSLLTLLFILMLESFYRDSLFNSSLDFISNVQQGASSGGIFIMEHYSDIGVAAGVAIPPIWLYFVLWKRIHALYYLMLITSLLFLSNVSKLWYNDPRPFWVREDVQALACSTQYGNPSAHSMFSMAIATTLWLDVNECHRSREGSFMQPIWARAILGLVCFVYTFTIGYSRVFLGVHSWNQLLFGWQLGLWVAVTFFFCYKGPVLYRLERFQSGK